VTSVNSNFVVPRFGDEMRTEDVLETITPIKQIIGGENYSTYPVKRCIWQGTTGNLFSINADGYADFSPLFSPATCTRLSCQ
ncbi:MAG: hypothetical protein ACNYVW_07825, partial [Methanosarcinales archaeon]